MNQQTRWLNARSSALCAAGGFLTGLITGFRSMAPGPVESDLFLFGQVIGTIAFMLGAVRPRLAALWSAGALSSIAGLAAFWSLQAQSVEDVLLNRSLGMFFANAPIIAAGAL